jgi:catechol 2,3-dioxygenase-like lactoylglutathione lyase family enzyme
MMKNADGVRVAALDHVNIRTGDVPGSARYYSDLLGLEPRDAPSPMTREQACWLFDQQGHAIIHLFKAEHTPGPTGAIHHVALRCTGKTALLDKLRERDEKFDVHEAGGGLTLIFLRDPHGVLLELNFTEG